jgi:prolipoprotein diacylglyceryltransferase
VGAHWAYYTDHLRGALQFWEGGLLWQGALLGGIIGVAATCAMRNRPLWVYLDALTPGAASLAVFAWLACHLIGCAWGVETYPGESLLWALSLDLPTLYGIREPRVAVQLLGAGWSLILLSIVLALQRRSQRSGAVFTLWLTIHSLGSAGLGFLRADKLLSVAGWRIDQLANLVLSAMGAALLFARGITTTRERVGGQR